MLLAISIIKALIEVAALSIMAQGVVGLFSLSKRANNPIYQLFGILTAPIHRVVRKITPRVVLDAHIPLVSFLLLGLLWCLALTLKVIESVPAAT